VRAREERGAPHFEIKVFSTFCQRVVTKSQRRIERIQSVRSTGHGRIAPRDYPNGGPRPSPAGDTAAAGTGCLILFISRPRATKACIERVLSSSTVPTARITEAVDVSLPFGLNKVDD
jgi:hypothetical protein